MSQYHFEIGARVQKLGGYRWPGIVVSRFVTLSDEIRYVVECTVPEVAGALHIYNQGQLIKLPPATTEGEGS